MPLTFTTSSYSILPLLEHSRTYDSESTDIANGLPDLPVYASGPLKMRPPLLCRHLEGQ